VRILGIVLIGLGRQSRPRCPVHGIRLRSSSFGVTGEPCNDGTSWLTAYCLLHTAPAVPPLRGAMARLIHDLPFWWFFCTYGKSCNNCATNLICRWWDLVVVSIP